MSDKSYKKWRDKLIKARDSGELHDLEALELMRLEDILEDKQTIVDLMKKLDETKDAMDELNRRRLEEQVKDRQTIYRLVALLEQTKVSRDEVPVTEVYSTETAIPEDTATKNFIGSNKL
jgi:hypothetical protein